MKIRRTLQWVINKLNLPQDVNIKELLEKNYISYKKVWTPDGKIDIKKSTMTDLMFKKFSVRIEE